MDNNDLSKHVADPDRLAALQAVALLDTPTEESFDRLTGLAARFVDAPVALVSLIDANRQFFKSCLGLPEPWLSRRETPLSHSFCQYNRIVSQPLLVEDARIHPIFKDNPAIRDLNVIAYIGIPLATSDGYVLGSFCVIDSKPRHWTEEDISVIRSLSVAVMTEIQLRTEITCRKKAEERLQAKNNELQNALDQLRQRDQLLIQQSRMAAMGEMISNIAHQWRQPINSLGLMLQTLQLEYQMGALTEESLEENVSKSMKLILQMSQTIDDFRNFFKPDKDRVLFDLKESILTGISMVEAGLKCEHVSIEVQCEEGIMMEGFPSEFSQAILNLVVNARDALCERQVTQPFIKFRVFSEHGRRVITITDNAGGIPEEIINKVFDPYFTTKGPDKGTGIGLFMSKMIIEKNMGGSLSVRNIGDGAEFRIAL